MHLSRRGLLASGLAATLPAQSLATANWEALAPGYRAPDWFRDAKFGIWAHWGPQCVPEAGDWYGRLMYVEGHPAYEHHLKHYGHPSRTGFLDIIGRWKAEAWDPEALMRRYVKAGARYFVAMASHHDNFDNFDSAHHAWNSVRVGPRRDIVGTWERIARRAGLKFGVSNHSSHAWHWWQTAYGYDPEGPLRGRRYDAYWLRKRDGRGKWWAGLDPQDLYTGPAFVPPDGIVSMSAMNAWHDRRDGQWLEDVPPHQSAFARNWLLRQNDLVGRYRPDLVYFDDSGIPFGRIGLDAVMHYLSRRPNGVVTAKRPTALQRRVIVEDVERGFVADIQQRPWQTDTCIGNWHYDRALFERHGYKSAKAVVQRLCDVVAKNGNLLLSIPVRGDGSIDADEEAILGQLADWFAVNGEAIYGTRPWRRFGEGPTAPPEGMLNEQDAKPFVAEDVRFTTGDGALHAFFLEWPGGEAEIASVGIRQLPHAVVEQVSFQDGQPLAFKRDVNGLRVTLPESSGFVPRVTIRGPGLV